MRIQDLDIFYISYDEPNAEHNWADLLSKAPWAKRVHGVKGFDNAHKECARQSETQRFITVDGDNIIDLEFLKEEIPNEEIKTDDVYSWAGKNHINNLSYGNGGLKCWPIHVVLNMKTHEEAIEEKNKVDFCWDLNYIQMNDIYSEVYCNASPFQAFRSGFREGSKMGLKDGLKIHFKDFKHEIHFKNYDRLLIWSSIGADVKNGIWAIYGARLGCYMTNLTDWNHHLISDYDWFNSFWLDDICPKFEGHEETCINTGFKWSKTKLLSNLKDLGSFLRKEMDLEIVEMDEDQSRFFKKVYVNQPRLGFTVKERDVKELN